MKSPSSVTAVALRARARGSLLALCLAGALPSYGQTAIDLRTQARNVDFSGAASTKPVKTGATLPASCAAGEIFFKTTAAAGKNLYTCSPANQWSLIAGAATGGAMNYAATFSGQTSVTLAHNLNTTAVTVQCFDDATPPSLLEANRVSVTDATRVDVTFVAAQSGTCVVSGSGGSGGGGSVTTGEGLLSSGGVIQVNPSAIRTYLNGSESLSFGTIAGNGGCAGRTIPVTGAVIGDRVTVGAPAELLTYSLAMTYAVTAADVVTIRLCNYTAAAILPPSWTWNVDVVKSF
jgi:hypothetical protein